MPTSNFQPIRLLDLDYCHDLLCYCYELTYLMAVQIQISRHLQKPTDLDLHCLQKQGISGFSRTRVKISNSLFHTFSPYFCFSYNLFLKIHDGMANSEDPDQAGAVLIWVCTVWMCHVVTLFGVRNFRTLTNTYLDTPLSYPWWHLSVLCDWT